VLFIGTQFSILYTASHSPLRTPGSSAQLEAKTAVTAVATQFFAKLWGTNLSRPVGAPTADRKERERAVGILSTSFGEWYLGENPAASSNVAEGTENKRILMNCVEVWWNSSSQAPELRLGQSRHQDCLCQKNLGVGG